MMMNALTPIKNWSRAVAFSLPVLAAQAITPALIHEFSGAKVGNLAFAQEESSGSERKTKRTQAINNKVYEKLQAAQEELEAKNTAEALKILNDLKNGSKPLNDAEMANVLNMLAYIYYSQEDYTQALSAYEKIITLPEASEGVVTQARFSVAQLYMVTDQWEKAIVALNEWSKVSTTPPSATTYMMYAQCYYQLKNYDQSLVSVEKAISLYKEKGSVPKESWYGLQRFLYYEKENYKKVVEILDELLLHYPKKEYWMQLSGMYSELKDDKKQLAAMETAFVQGMLEKEKELINVAYLFLANDVPYKAAKIIDQGMKEKKIDPTSKNLELLGNAWRQAQEVKKAIPEMARAAAKSDKGDLWTRLCSIYLDGDEFKKAIDACDKGLKKGGVKRPDTAHLVKGMAHFNLKQYDAARKEFREAAKDKRSKEYADQWIQFMNKELERQKSLEQV